MSVEKFSKTNKLQDVTNPNPLEIKTLQFKKVIIDFIKEQYVMNYLDNQKTHEKFIKNLEKNIKEEHNTINLPYYYILENLNLCIEVEDSETLVNEEKNEKFGQVKFSDIMKSGISNPKPINRFTISEKQFLSDLSMKISEYTQDYSTTEDSIKIEFN